MSSLFEGILLIIAVISITLLAVPSQDVVCEECPKCPAVETQTVPWITFNITNDTSYWSIGKNGSCVLASDCFFNSSLKGCERQDCNWCCGNFCTVLYCYEDSPSIGWYGNSNGWMTVVNLSG